MSTRLAVSSVGTGDGNLKPRLRGGAWERGVCWPHRLAPPSLIWTGLTSISPCSSCISDEGCTTPKDAVVHRTGQDRTRFIALSKPPIKVIMTVPQLNLFQGPREGLQGWSVLRRAWLRLASWEPTEAMGRSNWNGAGKSGRRTVGFPKDERRGEYWRFSSC